jgi:hypothetical protein
MVTRKDTRPAKDASPVSSEASQLVAQGHALMRIENETMLAVALQHPRNEEAVIKAALGELDLVPEDAARAFYSIPYRERGADGSTKIVHVEGPSIKAAMTLARRWGNCVTTARVLHEDVEGFDLEGIFIDLESNFRVARPIRVGKFIKLRAGNVMLLDPKKQEMAIQAGASKAIRNAVLAGLPSYLVNAYDSKARQIISGKTDAKPERKTLLAILETFSRWKITQAQLEQYVEHPVAEWTGREVADLRGLWNSINDGQVTLEDVFSARQDPTVVTPDSLHLGGAAVSAEDMHVRAEDDPRPGLVKAILEKKSHFTKQPTEEQWGLLLQAFGVSVDLIEADPAALTDCLHFLSRLVEHDPAAIQQAKKILGADG